MCDCNQRPRHAPPDRWDVARAAVYPRDDIPPPEGYRVLGGWEPISADPGYGFAWRRPLRCTVKVEWVDPPAREDG